MPGIRSAYRAVKERIKRPSVVKEMALLDTLEAQLDSDWKAIEKEKLISSLFNINDENSSLFRLIVLLSGLVGFLLTRGFNRFSRQGFRLAKTSR